MRHILRYIRFLLFQKSGESKIHTMKQLLELGFIQVELLLERAHMAS